MDAASPSRGNLWNRSQRWAALHPYWTLALATIMVLGPFLGKPFNIDDPLFIWTARQIQAHPLNPFGFEVNWGGTPQPMWMATQNPPLASYFMALAAEILGWSEIALHSASLLPAIAVVFGTYRLARRNCERPLLAALAALFAPVFLVSGTTVMCDVLMLAFWVWAVVWWVEGLERDNFRLLLGAGVLMALAAMTKYFAGCLIPLLAAHGWMTKRRFGSWTATLLIPLGTLGAWQWITRAHYQYGLLSGAMAYASILNGFFAGKRAATVLIALTHTGGCLAAVVFLAPFLWRTRTWLALVLGTILLDLAVFNEGTLWKMYYWVEGSSRLAVTGQIILWSIGGVSVLALAVADIWEHRDPSAWLLGWWVFGTFVFTAVFNWTINGRSILPMAPAVAILLARRLQRRPAPAELKLFIPLAASALLALAVTRSDYLLARAVRQSARLTHERYGRDPGKLWFQGHWGYQYYMMELGAQPENQKNPGLRPGDFLAVPAYNTNLQPPPGRPEEIYVDGPQWLTAMNVNAGAGFYTSQAGPLSFVFGDVPPDLVMVYRWK